jgi:hypothetical protein
MGVAEWGGVSFAEILAKVERLPGATQVLISGLDPEVGPFPGASWIFDVEELVNAGAALVTHMNGVPLPADHGHPLRLMVPGWYGCCWIKWVDHIRFVGDSTEATSQMKEYAGRTHQRGVPRLARDYAPATIDPAAMPVRVEKWRREGRLFYRVVGIAWGGSRPARGLSIRFDPANDFVPVENFAPKTHHTWTLWSHLWRPTRTGRYSIELRFDNSALRTRRMDQGFYQRSVVVDQG